MPCYKYTFILNRHLTPDVRTSLKAAFCTLSITRRPKITKGKRYSWWAPAPLVRPYRLRWIRPHLVGTYDRSRHCEGPPRQWRRCVPGLLFGFSALETKRSSDVTMFQRSSTYVMSVKHGVSRVFGSSLISFYKMNVATKNLLEQVFIPKAGPRQTLPIVSTRPSRYTSRNRFIKGLS